MPTHQNCVLVALQWRLKMPPRSVMSPPAPEPVPSRMSSKVPAGEVGGRGQRGDKHPSARAQSTQLQSARKTARTRTLLAAAESAHAREVQVETRPSPAGLAICRRRTRYLPVASTHATLERCSVRLGRHARAPVHDHAALACGIDSSIDEESADTWFSNQSHRFDDEL